MPGRELPAADVAAGAARVSGQRHGWGVWSARRDTPQQQGSEHARQCERWRSVWEVCVLLDAHRCRGGLFPMV